MKELNRKEKIRDNSDGGIESKSCSKKRCSRTTASVMDSDSSRYSSHVDDSPSNICIAVPTPPVLQPSNIPIVVSTAQFLRLSYEGFRVNSMLVGVRYIHVNGIYPYNQIDALEPHATGDIPSEILYI